MGYVFKFGSKELPTGIWKSEDFLDRKFLNGPLVPINRTISVARCAFTPEKFAVRARCFLMPRPATISTV
jgi:hypothetical protein